MCVDKGPHEFVETSEGELNLGVFSLRLRLWENPDPVWKFFDLYPHRPDLSLRFCVEGPLRSQSQSVSSVRCGFPKSRSRGPTGRSREEGPRKGSEETGVVRRRSTRSVDRICEDDGRLGRTLADVTTVVFWGLSPLHLRVSVRTLLDLGSRSLAPPSLSPDPTRREPYPVDGALRPVTPTRQR